MVHFLCRKLLVITRPGNQKGVVDAGRSKKPLELMGFVVQKNGEVDRKTTKRLDHAHQD